MRDVWLGLGAVFVGLTYLGTEYYRDIRSQEIAQEEAARHAAMANVRRTATMPANENRSVRAGPAVPFVQATQ